MSIASVVGADSPELYWKLDETTGTTAADSSGNSRPGTYKGSPALGRPGPEYCTDATSKAAFFDGLGMGDGDVSYVHRSTSPISGTGDASWEVWWRPSDELFDTSFEFHNLIQQRALGSNAGMVRVTTARSTDSIDLILGGPVVVTGDFTDLLNGRQRCWCHICATRSGNTWRLYVNSSEVGSASDSISVTADHLSFGADHRDVLNPQSNQAFKEYEATRGRMAHAAVYSSTLSAADISARWAEGCTGCGEGGAAAGIYVS